MIKNETELLNLAKNNDEYAFEQLLSNYKTLVTSICRRYFLVGGDVDDLLQEGMIGLFKAVKSYDATKNISFQNYAKTVVERQIINAIKQANSQKNSPLNHYVALNNQGGINVNDELFYIIKSNLESPEKLIQNQQSITQQFAQIRNALSDYEMQVLEQYINGEPYLAIAKNLNQTPKSVDNALNRIKNKLKFLKSEN